MKKENLLKMTLSQEDFGLVQNLLSQRVGISLSAGKEYLVVNRLSPLVDSFNFDSLHGLIQSLPQNHNTPLWDEVVDVLAVHETFFFRDQAPFQQLEVEILPSICAEAEKSGKEIKIWSAGASTGQEAYSCHVDCRNCSTVSGPSANRGKRCVVESVIVGSRGLLPKI